MRAKITIMFPCQKIGASLCIWTSIQTIQQQYKRRSPYAPAVQEAFVEGAASVESETQLQVTQPVELEVSSQELQPSAQAVVPSGPPTLASSGKPALRRKAPPPPEPLRLRDLKVHFFFIRHSARGSPILALELPIICGSCVISSPSIP